MVENVHPYHVTYLSNLPEILASGALKAKSLLDKEKTTYRDPTTELIREKERSMYERSKTIDDVYVVRNGHLDSVVCADVKKSCNLEDYVRLYLFNDGSFGANYLFRFVKHSWERYGGFVLFVFKSVIDLLKSATDYYFMLGAALSNYRRIYGDLDSFVRDLSENIHAYLSDYRAALVYKRVKNSLTGVLKWFLSSELGILNNIPLNQVSALFIFTGTEHKDILALIYEDFEPTNNETRPQSHADELETFWTKVLQQYSPFIEIRNSRKQKDYESLLGNLQVESWTVGIKKSFYYSREVNDTIGIINTILAVFNGGRVCPLP